MNDRDSLLLRFGVNPAAHPGARARRQSHELGEGPKERLVLDWTDGDGTSWTMKTPWRGLDFVPSPAPGKPVVTDPDTWVSPAGAVLEIASMTPEQAAAAIDDLTGRASDLLRRDWLHAEVDAVVSLSECAHERAQELHRLHDRSTTDPQVAVRWLEQHLATKLTNLRARAGR